MASKGAPGRQKVCHVVIKFHGVKTFVMTSIIATYVMMSKRSSLLQKVRHNVKNVMMSKRLSWCQKVCHEVKNTSWHQKHAMASEICKNKFCNEVKNMSWLQKVPYDVKNTLRRHNKTSKCSQNKVEKFVMMSNTSWRQKVCHDDKKFVMMSKTFHDVKRFVITLKSSSWCQKVCHDVKRLSWSKNIPWYQWHQKHIFILLCSRNDAKNVMTIKSWSWHQKYVITPKIRHYVKKARPDVKMFMM